MGMSLVLHGIRDSDSIEKETDLEDQIESSPDDSVDLYKIFGDLAMVLTNSIRPFNLPDSMGFKAVMGIAGEGHFEVGWRGVVGFLTNKQASEVFDWLKALKIDSEDRFLEFYDRLEEKVKQTLIDYGSEKDELFEGYLLPLLKFYEMIVNKKKAIIFCFE